MTDLTIGVTGWLFVAAAAMLWLGWTLLPVRLGTFLEPGDFGRVHARLHLWIWLYRLHLFGQVFTVMAFVAFATATSGSDARIVLWPAVAVLGVGSMVTALAGAFYYHFGAWGAIDMAGKPAEVVTAFVESLKPSTEYITCLVRFGRVFFGVGQVVLAAGLLLGGIFPVWLAVGGGVLGLAAIAVTMGFGDNLEYYTPLFHLNALWLASIGYVVLVSTAVS